MCQVLPRPLPPLSRSQASQGPFQAQGAEEPGRLRERQPPARQGTAAWDCEDSWVP